ncbi:MAG TPA: hypothetical protein VFO77_16200 [Actinoplanes sp.]|nr:hypothetical protein [Actinoplanes sp.]
MMSRGAAPHVLCNDHWRAGVLPGTGASVAFGQIRHDDEWVDLLRPTAADELADVEATASFPLVPWSNRVRDATLTWQGREYPLRANCPDGTAIHGAARDYAWDVVEADDTRVLFAFDSAAVPDANWPWHFRSTVEYVLDGADFTVTTSVTNADTEPFPAGLGHHPYFVRSLVGADDEVQVRIPCTEQFVLTEAMADAAPVPVAPWLDFLALREVGERFIDECLTGRKPDEPVELVYRRSGRRVELHCDELFEQIVFYVPQAGKPFLAIEPVTNANDGFTMLAAGVDGHGVFVLDPQESRQAAFTLRIADMESLDAE